MHFSAFLCIFSLSKLLNLRGVVLYFSILYKRLSEVVPSGIEPETTASETIVLSIGPRDLTLA